MKNEAIGTEVLEWAKEQLETSGKINNVTFDFADTEITPAAVSRKGVYSVDNKSYSVICRVKPNSDDTGYVCFSVEMIPVGIASSFPWE